MAGIGDHDQNQHAEWGHRKLRSDDEKAAWSFDIAPNYLAPSLPHVPRSTSSLNSYCISGEGNRLPIAVPITPLSRRSLR